LKDARGKRLTNCSAGINMMAVDYDGTMSACHGTLYSDMKKDFSNHISTNIKDPNQKFLTRFFESREELKKSTEYVADSCINCEATVCYKCPVVNIEQLNEFKPENFQVRDTRHCNIYKTFGKFDRALIESKSYKYRTI
jgi:radical SAM protein with 4Fe4S-binding SPASM domain